MKMQKIPLIQTKGTYASSPNVSVHEGSKIEELLRYIENRYVDEVDREELVDKAIRTILDELDPHSSYIDADHLKSVNEQLQGNFEGVGIEFLMVDDTILVVSPISGGPSDKVGILANDKIISIEDSIVAGVNITFPEIVTKLRGSATTHIEFMDSLEYMVEKDGLKDLVIDLRQNPGGYLQEATKMLSQLFDEKQQLLVYTEGRTVKRSDYRVISGELFSQDSIAILDTIKYYTKKDKRIVYGGGGITPDLFVPVDSLELNRNFLELREHIPQFVYRQLENQTDKFKDYSMNAWIKSYRVTDQMVLDLADYAKGKGVEIDAEELKEIKPLVKTMLKARVARQYYGEEGSFKVLNQADKIIKTAIRALKEKEPVALE